MVQSVQQPMYIQGREKKKKKFSVGQLCLHIFFILLTLAYVLPLVLMVSASFTDEAALTAGGFSLLPSKFSTEAYGMVFNAPDQLLQSYGVTTFVSFAGMILHCLVMSVMAYPLSRRVFAFRKFFNYMAFFTMLFSGGLVPTYLLITKYLGLKNNIWVYIIPSLGSAWNMIILRTGFSQLPDSLVESAKIDGASEFRICFQIVIPLSIPVIATIGFNYFIGKWNDWSTCIYYINKPNLYSLQYLLQRILREIEYLKQLSEADRALLEQMEYPAESFRFAMAVLAAGPVMFVFPFFQKYFSKGMIVGSVKG